MNVNVLSGRFHAGKDFKCGRNVQINVAEEVVVGDRVTLADNTYIEGRRVVIGDDFYGHFGGHAGYHPGLTVGDGRIDSEFAILTVGRRCTAHNNRIDLDREVTIGDDVGLSPDVVLYTHGYWMSPLDGFPMRHDTITIGHEVIVGFRSVILPGARVGNKCVIGAQSVVAGTLPGNAVYGGNPARCLRRLALPEPADQEDMASQIVLAYRRSREYRGLPAGATLQYPIVRVGQCSFNVLNLTCEGTEDVDTDDWRDFAFKHGLRFYTGRPFWRRPRLRRVAL